MSYCLACNRALEEEVHYHQKCLKDFWKEDEPVLSLDLDLANIQDVPNHYRPVDIAISMDADIWAKLYLNETDMQQEIQSGKVKVTKGESEEIIALYELFDKFNPDDNLFIPR